MAQQRVGESGIKDRKLRIERIEAQIEIWTAMKDDKSKGLSLTREATGRGVSTIKDQILDRVKTLSFSSDADRLDLAKLAGRLDGLESIYYDIADAQKKIDNARLVIAKLDDEIKRIKKGDLLETGA